MREVIAGWDVGILGDSEKGIPPMKVTANVQQECQQNAGPLWVH